MRNLLPLALDGTDPASISLTVLLTGLIVVFLVLICLTFIIYLYGAVVHKALGKKKAPAPEKSPKFPLLRLLYKFVPIQTLSAAARARPSRRPPSWLKRFSSVPK